MADKFDVSSRLAEGRPAVDNVQNYVWACQLLGYQNPDLTLHASQVRDWYGSEDGLDLRTLDADRAALESVVAATQDALARQDDQLAELAAVWHGPGADASQQFLRRHVEASVTVAAAVRTATEALTTLRDNLWHAVDGKVVAATAIDERTQAQRPDWLAAAQTVATGAGDRAAASEVIDQSVKPFVDNDIRTDWLSAMREAMAATTDAYDAALSELGSEALAVFDVPGDLGPSWTPPRVDDTANTPAAGVTAPASATPATLPGAGSPVWSVPAAVPPPPPMPSPPSEWTAPAPPLDPAAAVPAAAVPAMPSPSGLGGGAPDIGSGLSGFGQQLADTLGSLFDNSSGDALPEPAELEPPDAEELDESDTIDDEPDDESDTIDEESDAEPDEELTEESDDELGRDPTADMCAAGEEPVDPAADDLSTEPPPAPAPTSVPEPPTTPAPAAPFEPIPPPSPAGPAEPAATPCEIAADELPQVGESPG
ncbi:hypothetical protein [Mycobacterium sp. URHB0021]|jgi:hypothetical protein